MTSTPPTAQRPRLVPVAQAPPAARRGPPGEVAAAAGLRRSPLPVRALLRHARAGQPPERALLRRRGRRRALRRARLPGRPALTLSLLRRLYRDPGGAARRAGRRRAGDAGPHHAR